MSPGPSTLDEDKLHETLHATQVALRTKGFLPLSEAAWRSLDPYTPGTTEGFLAAVSQAWTDPDPALAAILYRANARGDNPTRRPPGYTARPYTDGGRLPVQPGDVIQIRGIPDRDDINGSCGYMLPADIQPPAGRLAVRLLHGGKPLSVPKTCVYHIWDAVGDHPLHTTLAKWRGANAYLAHHRRRVMGPHTLRYMLQTPQPIFEDWLDELATAAGALHGETLDQRFLEFLANQAPLPHPSYSRAAWPPYANDGIALCS